MPDNVIYAPIVIQKLMSQAQDFKNFRIQVRKKGTTFVLDDSEIGGNLTKNKQWVSIPYVFEGAVKDSVYQFRVCQVTLNGVSAWSLWYNKTAGDNTFGAVTWNNSIVETDHSLIVSIELQTVPSDFDYIEVYVRDTMVPDSSSSTTYTDTKVTDSSAWDLSNAQIGDIVHAGTSYGTITNVNDGSNFVEVGSWTGGTPANGIIANIDHVDTTQSSEWEADERKEKAIFNYMWTGDRFVTKYFYVRAYDQSGNPSSLSSPVRGSINIILPGDMDTTPPDGTTVTLVMPGDDP